MVSVEEWSNQFDVHYNNITSNQAPGLSEYEKSVFLTKAQKEVTKNHFTATSRGNNLQQGFDDSALRQIDFSMLMDTGYCVHQSPYSLICTSSDSTEGTQTINADNINIYYDGSGTPTWEEVALDIPYTVTYDSSVSPVRVSFSNGQHTYLITGWPFTHGGTIEKMQGFVTIDSRSNIFSYPDNVFIVVNESIKTSTNKYLQVIPLRYDEYTRLMTKPFKRPLKYQAWRLLNSGEKSDNVSAKYVEIVTNANDTIANKGYTVRYIKAPYPIILTSLAADMLSIDGYYGGTDEFTPTSDRNAAVSGITCMLDPMLHEEILQRAVELAKVAWTATGQDNVQVMMAAGQRSE